MYTQDQIALQTFIENGLVPAWRLDFAASIAHARRPSPKQEQCIKDVIQQVLNPKPVAAATPGIDVKPIFDLFANAVMHMKYPKILLQTKHNANVRFSYSSKNNNPTIWMNQGGFGSNCYGMMRDNFITIYVGGEAIKQDLLELITEFAAAPAAVAAKYGKMTRNCCFCCKTLDTKESLDAGYGPVCAQHYGLPWG